IPSLEERLDGRLQVANTEEDAAANGLVIEMAEPSLDEIHPAGTRGDKVRHEPRMTCQPGLYFRMGVRPVIVHDQMERDLARELRIESAEEFQKLLMAVSRMAFADDLAA